MLKLVEFNTADFSVDVNINQGLVRVTYSTLLDEQKITVGFANQIRHISTKKSIISAR